MPALTTDIPWLSCLSREIFADLAGKGVRVRRHADRPYVWIDGGGDQSWVGDLSPGASRMRRIQPGGDIGLREEWRDWGGRRTEGATLVSAEVRGCDRVIVLRLDWNSRLGENASTNLILEFGGRHTNAVLADAETGQIVDVLRPVSGKVNRFREVLPGRTYVPPPSFDRARIDEPWDWLRAGEKSVRKFLQEGFLGGSRPWFDELLHRCGVDGATKVADIAPDARELLEQTANGMIRDGAAFVLYNELDEPIDHLGYELTDVDGGKCEPAASCAEAVELVWGAREQVEQRTRREQSYRAHVKRRRSELERRRAHLLDDLSRTENSGELSRTADLIMASIGTIPSRATEVELVDWYDPDQRTVTVRLDPDRQPAEQANQMYQRSRKLRESVAHIEARLRRTERELAALPEPGEEPTDEMLEDMARKAQNSEASQNRPWKEEGGIRPRRYRTRDGNWLVLVGRNDNENDRLSLKVAASDDLWFHAHGCPGSHVVLRREGRPDNPSRQAIAEAAAVAAYWSKARGAQKVGVSYTEAKYVRKTKGAPPGQVNIRHEKLVTVPPAQLPRDDESGAEPDEG